MKKINNILALLVIALMGLSLTACSSDNLDTNQFQGDVSLNAFGPNPVMRGGTLRFVGSNLDQVASINIPGIGEVTNFDVIKSGVPSEIRVAIPKDGPTVGKVVLKTRSDQKIETQNELTYIEGIEVTGFTPAEADPGTIIKIEGDYLNLIYSIAFADGVLVSSSEFKSWDRYFIEVAVPEEAQTGKIELYTADLTIQRTKKEEDELEYQTFITEEALIVGLPTASKIESPRGVAGDDGVVKAKAGETITLTGKFFNVVTGVKIGDVLIEDITVNADGTTLSFALPAEAPSGAINLVCKSGVEDVVGMLATILPSECVAAPSPVKAGNALTITGNDLDIVTSVMFSDIEGNYTVAGGDITAAANKVVINSVPETAAEGNLRLITASGEYTEVAFTLVKPTVTGYDNATVSAGGALTIQGTDLDLVKTVQFGESDVVAVEGSADAITLTVPMNAASGAPTLTLDNGTKVENVPALTVEEAV
ncbi:MAG: polygalacturonase, partial [Prevotella sp.]|nr:polygalacturonase [Prevotella sp.]